LTCSSPGSVRSTRSWLGRSNGAWKPRYGCSGLPKGRMLDRVRRSRGSARLVYVSDTVGDAHAAADAGMEFIHVCWGFGRPQGSSPAAHSFAELLAYLRGE
jgi:phosphoglycolate phosphatase-like HAD superfamily hydrolase